VHIGGSQPVSREHRITRDFSIDITPHPALRIFSGSATGNAVSRLRKNREINTTLSACVNGRSAITGKQAFDLGLMRAALHMLQYKIY
jgi:hypothetical protein